VRPSGFTRAGTPKSARLHQRSVNRKSQIANRAPNQFPARVLTGAHDSPFAIRDS
jgi:hypothetical protein